MPIARRHYPILLGEKGELDNVEVDNTIRNSWLTIYSLQEDMTLMQEKVAGAIRRGEIAEDDQAASVSKVAEAVRTTVVSSPTTITGAKLVSPLAGRLPFINTSLELDGGVDAPEYNRATKALTIRGAINVTGAVTALSTMAITGAVTMASTLTIQGATIIDGDSAEQFLVRKDGDAGDVFTVDNATDNVNVNDATFNLLGTAELVIAQAHGHGLATAGSTAIGVHLRGGITAANPTTVRIQSQLNPSSGTVANALSIFGVTYQEFSSGTHAEFNGIILGGAIVTAGSAAVTTTAQLHIVNTINALGATQYAIWVEAGNSLLQAVDVNGTLTTKGRIKTVTRKTTTYTILVTDSVIFCNTDSAGFTATLPAGVSGQTFKVINSGSSGNILTLAPDGSEHLLGVNSSFNLFDAETLDLTYDSTDGWY